ncbi:MAG: Asp-tRNA(Asn)/Glu-tRNA(Gln) amidotransferase GatCAB subunit B, partial [candidate division Zixibacteria bacterium]|nr:Asp-tRNA(Asn)/Glu-tRNA(Gln) amidotransferase GatCAB subunit B [candidate division Zixibacteria bacterium]
SDGKISSTAVKAVFEQMVVTGKSPKDIVTEGGLSQISDGTMLGQLVDRVLDDNQDQVATYRSGNQRVLAFFVGQVMKNSKGKANPQRISELLKQRLDQS